MKKQAINTMKMIFDSDSRNESFARSAVTAFVTQIDPTFEELSDIRTMVSEAVTNCIVHAYRGGRGSIVLQMVLYADRSLRISVKDKGCGIADIEQAMQPLFTTDQSGERGGMGFAIMQSFSDRLKVSSHPGIGTSVIMKKQLT